jgi:hypothetical protein
MDGSGFLLPRGDMQVVIVTGGRNYWDAGLLARVLDAFEIKLLVQGGASGADLLAAEYAQLRNIPCETVRAEWANEGRSAGPRRNKRMLEKYPYAIVVAFPGGRGTMDCVNQAIKNRMVVLQVGKNYAGT